MCYILLRLICLIFFFLNIKSADDPIKEGRYCVFDEENFNPEFLDEVKNYLKENNQEIFYLFPVEEAYLIDFTKDIKEEMTKENTIYYSKCNFGSELLKLYVNPKKFVENTENCGYINFTKGKLEVKKYISMCTSKGKTYREIKSLSTLDKGDAMKNSMNDQPLIFQLRFQNGYERFYFCSNIGIITEYLYQNNKKLSLFKKDIIKSFFLVNNFKEYNNFDCIFYDCDNLNTIYFCIDKQIYIDGDSLFEGCINLERIGNFYMVLNTKKSNFVFKNCKNLTNAYVHADFILGDYCFEKCKKLEMVFPTNYSGAAYYKKYFSIVSTGCFKNCFSLRKVSYHLDFSGDPIELFYGCSNLDELKISFDISKNKDYTYKDMFYGVECKDVAEITFKTNDPDFRIPREKITAMFNGCKIPNDKIKFIIHDTKNHVETPIHGYEKFLQSNFVSKEDDILKGQGHYKVNGEESTTNIYEKRSTLIEKGKIEEVKKNIEDGSNFGHPCLNCCCCQRCCI